LADIFAVQDEITAAIATAIAPAIINAEQQRVLGKSPERLDAWEAYHRGMWHFSKGSDNVSTARDFFQKSVNLDPNFAAAYAALAGSTMVIADFEDNAYGYRPARGAVDAVKGRAPALVPGLHRR
jgi:hypothetical protein